MAVWIIILTVIVCGLSGVSLCAFNRIKALERQSHEQYLQILHLVSKTAFLDLKKKNGPENQMVIK